MIFLNLYCKIECWSIYVKIAYKMDKYLISRLNVANLEFAKLALRVKSPMEILKSWQLWWWVWADSIFLWYSDQVFNSEQHQRSSDKIVLNDHFKTSLICRCLHPSVCRRQPFYHPIIVNYHRVLSNHH
jgi:hypothetical protein